ncbi:Ubiquitin receptor RAD23b [Glycine soja]
MKLTVKTLKGSHFEIRVQPSDTVMAVKKNIEDVQGKDNYPCGQQLLIHNGKVLKDETTLVENKVSEDGFLVVMLSKSKTSGSAAASSVQPASNPATTVSMSNSTPPSDPPVQTQAANNSTSSTDAPTTNVSADTYGLAASNLVAGSNLEQTIQQIMDMGGGNWDRDTVSRALRAAYNNPERAIDYLYSGIPEAAEVAVPVPQTAGMSSGAVPVGPNSSPLNMFPQETISSTGAGLGSLDFLRNNPQVPIILTKFEIGSPYWLTALDSVNGCLQYVRSTHRQCLHLDFLDYIQFVHATDNVNHLKNECETTEIPKLCDMVSLVSPSLYKDMILHNVYMLKMNREEKDGFSLFINAGDWLGNSPGKRWVTDGKSRTRLWMSSLARQDLCQHWAVLGSAVRSCNSDGSSEQSAMRSEEVRAGSSKKKSIKRRSYKVGLVDKREGGEREVVASPGVFQALRSMVQSNPQILQPVLQELGKQNPGLLRLIQEHHGEFLQLINEPVEGSEGDMFEQPEQDMPHAINVTPAEQEAIGRLEAMGFDRASVIEAFLACDRDEQLAANYLLENAGDFED